MEIKKLRLTLWRTLHIVTIALAVVLTIKIFTNIKISVPTQSTDLNDPLSVLNALNRPFTDFEKNEYPKSSYKARAVIIDNTYVYVEANQESFLYYRSLTPTCHAEGHWDHNVITCTDPSLLSFFKKLVLKAGLSELHVDPAHTLKYYLFPQAFKGYEIKPLEPMQ